VRGSVRPSYRTADALAGERGRQPDGVLLVAREEGNGRARAGDDAAEGTEVLAGVEELAQLRPQREGGGLQVVREDVAERDGITAASTAEASLTTPTGPLSR
jgi:hypothetical protein